MSYLQKLQQSSKAAHIFLVGLFFFLLPLYRWFLPSVIVLLVVTWVFSGDYKEKWKDISNPFILLCITYFLYNALFYFLSEDKQKAGIDIEQKLALIIFPVISLGSGYFFKKYKNLFFKFFIASNIVSLIINFGRAFFLSTSVTNSNLHFDFSVLQNGATFLSSTAVGGNFFTYMSFSTFLHPAYAAMYLCFSLILLLVMKADGIIKNGKENVIFYLTLMLFSIGIILLSSRAGMLSLLLVFFGKIVHIIIKSKQRWIKFSAPLIFILSLFIIMNNPRFASAISEVKHLFSSNAEISKAKDISERFMMWRAGIALSKENLWLGVGTGDVKKELNNKYATFPTSKNNHIDLNAHNQYIETFAATGVFGFLLLLILLFSIIWEGIRKRDIVILGFSALILFNFIFESMLNTISGVVFFAFFYTFLLSKKETIKKDVL